MKSKFSLFLLFFFCISSVFYAQNIEEKVDKYIKWMVRDKNPNFLGAAERLQKLGIKAVPVIKRKSRDLPGRAKLGCFQALINLGELDYVQEKLLRFLKKRNKRHSKVMAANMLEMIGDFDLEEDLLEILDSTFDPFVKIAIAKTTWQVSRAPAAIKTLKSFLRSENFNLQATAALALGEVGNVKAALPILNKLKRQATPEGRMAQMLVRHNAQINNYEVLLDAQGSIGDPSDSKDKKLKYPLVDEVISKINEYHVKGDKFSKLKLLNAAVDGMVSSTDIHSAFWTEKQWDDFVKTTINEGYVGIGVYVGDRDGQFTIISPIYTGPAYKAGIRSMDQILKVNGWATRDQSTDEIIKKIKGDKGSFVTLTVYRKGWSKTREIKVRREKIRVPSLFVQMLPGKIGYVKLTQFGRKGTEDMEKALVQLEKDGMKGFILDLRGNGGGWLQVAVDIVDKFVSGKKLIVYSEGRHAVKGKRYDYFGTEEATHPDFPMVVLVDQSSASASEIVSGALQHYKRAVIVGKQTFGKGSVQEPIQLDTRPGARLKLTIALYYLPDGRCIHNIMDAEGKLLKHNGIIPDIKVEYDSWETWKNEEYSKLEENKRFEKYIDKYYQQDEARFNNLAENDQLDYSLYPDFTNWYNSLHTRATKQDVRFWLRSKIRARVSDKKGKQYACDYLEDSMLQRGIKELCEKNGLDLRDIEEYKIFSEKFKK